MSRTKIVSFLRELKSSYHKNELIYTEGSCFRVYSMLKVLFENVKPYYSSKEGHWITEIDNRFYDINGEITKSHVENHGYTLCEDEVMLASAYIPTYRRQQVRYDKYK